MAPNPRHWTGQRNLKACLMLSEGRLWIGAHLPESGQQANLAERIDLTAFEWNLPVVATQRPLMHIRQRLKLQHTMTAIRLGAPIVEVADQLERSSERTLIADCPRASRNATQNPGYTNHSIFWIVSIFHWVTCVMNILRNLSTAISK